MKAENIIGVGGARFQQEKAIQRLSRDSHGFARSVDNGSWTAHKTMADLVLGLNLNKVRILDVGCHHANLLDAIAKQGKLKNIESYDGIDLSANAIEAARSKYPNFNFEQADALQSDTYKGISNNNVIVCSGICDFLCPSAIDMLLTNLNGVLAKDDDSRIFINYRTIKTIYGSNDRQINLSSKRAETECGVHYHIVGNEEPGGILDYYYHPDEFRKLIERNGFEIVVESSKSDSPDEVTPYDHICLKRKS